MEFIGPPEAGGWIRRMRPLMRRHRRTLVLALLGAVVGMVATVFGPLCCGGSSMT